MSVLRVNCVGADVAGHSLLRDISLTLEAGKIASVIGPNGAGKTTLLRAIATDLPAVTGSIMLNAAALASIPAHERAQQLAVLTQANPLAFAFTGAEVVALSRSPHSTGACIDADICRQAMAALDVSHLAERLYPSLSGGEQQRIQLARVMAQIWRAEDAGERLLLLDEPVTSLDLGHQHQLMQAVKTFAASGVAVVMVMHDMTLAATYSDWLLALKKGYCVAQGEPHKVLTEKLVGDLFNADVSIIAHPKTGKPVVLGT